MLAYCHRAPGLMILCLQKHEKEQLFVLVTAMCIAGNYKCWPSSYFIKPRCVRMWTILVIILSIYSYRFLLQVAFLTGRSLGALNG